MGIHEWSYDNDVSPDVRYKVPWADAAKTLKSIKLEVELGFDAETAWKETQRCLNCDVRDRVHARISASSAMRASTSVRWIASRSRATATKPSCGIALSAEALNTTQDLYVSGELKTGRVMVKDEDVCLHCGLCAERCPTGAWDMQKFLLEMTYAGPGCRKAPARNGA